MNFKNIILTISFKFQENSIKKYIYILLLNFFIFSSCTTPSSNLKKHSPNLYNNIIDQKIYLLDSNKHGKIRSYLSFNNDAVLIPIILYIQLVINGII